MSRTKFKPLICAKCGQRDSSTRAGGPLGYVGTSTEMRCPDCGIGTDAHPHALLCRMCCPTAHGTQSEIDSINARLDRAHAAGISSGVEYQQALDDKAAYLRSQVRVS